MSRSNPRIAVFGCGYWGQNLVRNFQALGVLQGVCDPNDTARKRALELAPTTQVSRSFEELLHSDDVTAVAIATPAETHHRLALAAMQAGKDVFVEKPLALNRQAGEELCEEAARQGRVLMVGHLLRYHPCVERLLAMVQAGELGRLQYVFSHRLNLGKSGERRTPCGVLPPTISR